MRTHSFVGVFSTLGIHRDVVRLSSWICRSEELKRATEVLDVQKTWKVSWKLTLRKRSELREDPSVVLWRLREDWMVLWLLREVV